MEIFMDRWGSKYVIGDEEVSKPNLVGFKHIDKAVKLLHKHINKSSKIAIHCDVDLDGVASGYEWKKFLLSVGIQNPIFIINAEKEHGIKQKHADYFNKNKIDLLIIVDSSSNEIETIKKFDCDVIVFDHHEINHSDTYAQSTYEYIIINNMISNDDVSEINELLSTGSTVNQMDSQTDIFNFESSRKRRPVLEGTEIEPYVADSRMSGAQVVYESLRVYCRVYGLDNWLETLKLQQWVGVTLLSDAVATISDRNQWYMKETIGVNDVEECLYVLTSSLNEYRGFLSKTFVSYTLVPIINKTIRAGQSLKALQTVLYNPHQIKELREYEVLQKEAIEKANSKSNMIIGDEYIIKDITGLGISKNYCGVIASNLCGSYHKNAIVFIRDGNLARGSFRGRRSNIDYRNFISEYSEETRAEGHKAACGFVAPVSELENIMSKLDSLEPKELNKFYLTAGDMTLGLRGKYHIESMEEFKKAWNLIRLAIANSRLSTEEHLEIHTTIGEVSLFEQRGKVYLYDVLGLRCKAFEEITTEIVSIYAEYDNGINLYLRNYNMI